MDAGWNVKNSSMLRYAIIGKIRVDFPNNDGTDITLKFRWRMTGRELTEAG